ncbi:MAG: hypothetical protein JEZ06_00455 [Anaerolineaceae bacterium]|nr:hypothetical protein [Anaerolineaceae bacterium]
MMRGKRYMKIRVLSGMFLQVKGQDENLPFAPGKVVEVEVSLGKELIGSGRAAEVGPKKNPVEKAVGSAGKK